MRRLASLALALACGPSCSRPAPAADHVLLVVVDTLRADHLGCFGYPRDTSPEIDRLASAGVLFRQAISQGSYTSPSMVSLMTGHYIAKERLDIPADLTTLAESFHAAGFATAGFASNDFISAANGFARGFDRFERIQEFGSNESIADWLESVQGKRSFTYIHITEPHDPYKREDGGEQKWKTAKDLLPGDRAEYYRKVADELGLSTLARDVARITEEIGAYDDDVRYADGRVGEFVRLFEAAGLRSTGVIALTADHGEGLWEHVALMNGQRGQALRRGEAPSLLNTLMPTHGNQVHHELVNVPLVLAGAGLPDGVVVDAPVENVSLYPTLLELASVRGPEKLQGRSLLRWLEGPEPPVEFAFSFTRFNATVIDSNGWALILPTDEGECGEGLTLQLFDLNRDPHQRTDVAHAHPDVVARLRELAMRRLSQGIAEAGEVNDSSLAAMKALGYTGLEEQENERREIAAMTTQEILEQCVNMAKPCQRRLLGLAELAKEGRALDEAALERLREHRRFETSKGALALLARILDD